MPAAVVAQLNYVSGIIGSHGELNVIEPQRSLAMHVWCAPTRHASHPHQRSVSVAKLATRIGQALQLSVR